MPRKMVKHILKKMIMEVLLRLIEIQNMQPLLPGMFVKIVNKLCFVFMGFIIFDLL